MDTELGPWLAAEISRRGISRAKFARAAGIDSSVVGRIINGERQPMLETLNRIAAALEVPTEDLARLAGKLPPRAAPGRRLHEHSRSAERPTTPQSDDDEGRDFELIMEWDRLPEDEKRLIISVVGPMLEQYRREKNK